jgi:hypothetical protein
MNGAMTVQALHTSAALKAGGGAVPVWHGKPSASASASSASASASGADAGGAESGGVVVGAVGEEFSYLDQSLINKW